MRLVIGALSMLTVVAQTPLGAQTKADTLQHATEVVGSRRVTFGVSAGAMHFGDGGHERAISSAIGVSLPLGFSVGVNPTYAWAQAAPSVDATTGRLLAAAPVQGVADLPVSVGYSHGLPGAWSPGFYVSLGATLPTGDTTTVGSGETALGTNFGAWLEPVPGWSLSVDAGRSLSNGFASMLGAIGPTSVSVGASHAVGPVSLNLGYSTEAGAMPAGTTHSQNYVGGMSLPLGGDARFSVDGSLGRADGTQSWALSAGIGTTIASVGQVNPYAAAQRLASAFGHGRSMGKSRSTAAKAAAAAKAKSKGKKTA